MFANFYPLGLESSGECKFSTCKPLEKPEQSIFHGRIVNIRRLTKLKNYRNKKFKKLEIKNFKNLKI